MVKSASILGWRVLYKGFIISYIHGKSQRSEFKLHSLNKCCASKPEFIETPVYDARINFKWDAEP